MRGSADDLARAALANQADALAHFLSGPALVDPSSAAIPTELLKIMRQHHVIAMLVPPSAVIRAPMQASDKANPERGFVISALRRDASGDRVYYEFRALGGGYSLYLSQPDSEGDRTTRALLLRMGYGSLLALSIAMAFIFFYTRRATAPIRNAVAAAEHMAEGSRDVRLVEGGVAEIADLSRSMNELSDALANSEDRQRQFLLSVSHELRTPLTAIGGYAEALADGVIDGDEVAPTGAVMRSESERLQRLVSDLLDLSRAGAVELRLAAGDVDVTALVRSAGLVWRDRCEREGVLFSLDVPHKPVHITTDPLRLRQIIDNLCENALRVTPEGRPLVIALRDTGDGVAIEVRDGGPGLSDDDLLVAFEPSALHDRYVGIRPVGTGVGLALVGRFAARLGGSAEAGRADEGGARFTVRLPRRWTRTPA